MKPEVTSIEHCHLPVDMSHYDHCSAALVFAREIAGRYGIVAVQPLITACESMMNTRDLSIAVFGRFKAGKSSFLNSLFSKDLLPVGVIPVTSVITEVRYGPAELVRVHFLDGHAQEVGTSEVTSFVAEKENPQNRKSVSRVEVQLPSLRQFKAVHFIDTPGLESVLAHNTEATRQWLPNVGLAIVAIGVDPPLSSQDVELIRELYEFTPHIALLVTKVDIMSVQDREEVLAFVRAQLEKTLNIVPRIFPFSVRPGYEQMRQALETELLKSAAENFEEHRLSVLDRKVETLLQECGDYLQLALRSAEVADAGRARLRDQILGDQESIVQVKVGMKLHAQHIRGKLRSIFEDHLRQREKELDAVLIPQLQQQYPDWARSMGKVISSFSSWIRQVLRNEMGRLSRLHHGDFVAPIRILEAQLTNTLQDFQNRLSHRALETLGVRLRTSVSELSPAEPRQPDVSISHVFDHNWELMSWLIPMSVFRAIVRQHLEEKTRREITKNLSRLTSQWEESVADALLKVRALAETRLDEFVLTIEKILASTAELAGDVREDLVRLEDLRGKLQKTSLVGR